MSKPTIWVPPSSRIHDTPGQYVCEVCWNRLPEQERDGARFNTPAELWRHVEGTPGRPGCTDRHHDTVVQMSPALQAPGLFNENYEGGDLEWKAWIDRHREADPEGWREWMKTSEEL